VVSVCGKVAPVSAAGVGQEGERKRSTDDVSKGKQDDIETGCEHEYRRRVLIVDGGPVGCGAVREMEVVWPSGIALRGEVPNRPVLRWLKTVVVSDREKARL
jgi:hypothetical protein